MTSPSAQYQTPGDYLAPADASFAAGNHDAGSTLLTQSVHCALAQLAAEAGKPAGTRAELREFAEWLDRKHGMDSWHAQNLRTANGFDDNASYHYMCPDDIDLAQPLVREFLAVLLTYRQNPASND